MKTPTEIAQNVTRGMIFLTKSHSEIVLEVQLRVIKGIEEYQKGLNHENTN